MIPRQENSSPASSALHSSQMPSRRLRAQQPVADAQRPLAPGGSSGRAGCGASGGPSRPTSGISPSRRRRRCRSARARRSPASPATCNGRRPARSGRGSRSGGLGPPAGRQVAMVVDDGQIPGETVVQPPAVAFCSRKFSVMNTSLKGKPHRFKYCLGALTAYQTFAGGCASIAGQRRLRRRQRRRRGPPPGERRPGGRSAGPAAAPAG